MSEAKTARLLGGLALLVALGALTLAFLAYGAARRAHERHDRLLAQLKAERAAAKKLESPAGEILDALGVPGGKLVGEALDELAKPVPASQLPDKFTWRGKWWVKMPRMVGVEKLATQGRIRDLRFPPLFRGWRRELFMETRYGVEFVKASLGAEVVWYAQGKDVEPADETEERVTPRRSESRRSRR